MTLYLRRRDDGFCISHPGPDFKGHKDFEEVDIPDDVNPQPAAFLGEPVDPDYVQVAPARRGKKTPAAE